MNRIKFLPARIFLILIFAVNGAAQTTEFTYQGKLLDGATPPTAAYDFEFRLYDAASGGTLIGALARPGVAVTNGVFSVKLDFGNQFTGANRFLEIAVKPAGNPGGYQQLLPRQTFTSSPYTIRALNSTTADGLSSACTGCVSDANISSLSGGKITGQIPAASVPIGSGGFIQNTINEQSADFNLTGSGRLGGSLSAGSVNSTTTYSINGHRVIAIGAGDLNPNSSLFVGLNAGGTLLGGDNNSFFGLNAGASNTSGRYNSFFGESAGYSNTSSFNSFFGMRSGLANTTGNRNSFFGHAAGFSNTTGSNNAFFGESSGSSNTTAEKNSFFGASSGSQNTTGHSNSFFGEKAGSSNTTGIQNSFFGREAGYNNTGGNNVFVGFQAGYNSVSGINNVFVGTFAGNTNTSGSGNTIIGHSADVAAANLTNATAIGAGAIVSTSNTIVLGRTGGQDKVRIFGLGTNGTTPLCRNASGEISTCSAAIAESSDWLNAFREQTRQIDEQKEIIRRQQESLDRQAIEIERQKTELLALKKLVCANNPAAQICQTSEEKQ